MNIGLSAAMTASLCLAASGAFAAGVHDVREYGARGDGVTKDTSAIERAIAAASAQGGEVVFPAGRYRCGTVHLRSHITLRLLSGATLLASHEQTDFDPYETLNYDSHADVETTYSHYALLAGDGVEDVAILGPGEVDGNRIKRGGPKPIALKNARQITVRDITVRNAPNYAISLLGCDHVVVDGVTIRNAYADGIDPDSCRFVRIANCFVDSADDAICLKASLALGRRRATEHVTVTNCVLSSGSNNFKTGTESSGGFRNIAVSNCAMFGRTGDPANSGLAIEMVDGGALANVVISNITMQDVRNPLFVRLGNRGRGQSPPVAGSLENVTVSNVIATGALVPISITGVPARSVRRVTLADVQIAMAGGEGRAGGLRVPEAAKEYPDCDMFGLLPAYGLYCRHVDGLTLRDVQVRWQNPDARPALVADDVRDLQLSALHVDSLARQQPAVWLHRCVGALLQGCRAGIPMDLFLRVTGAETRDVTLMGNALSRCRRAVERGPGVSRSSLVVHAAAP